jgi:catechol 2,3-dioxygenase-like lactoylglutathione lyase family enzyme
MQGSCERVRRGLGWIAVGAAAILVVLVLAKGNADVLAFRLLFSSILAILIGLVVLVSARLARREDWRSLLGATTVLIAISTFVVLMVLFWKGGDRGIGLDSKGSVVILVVTLGLTGISLLFSGDRDDQLLRIARGVGAVALAAVAALTIFEETGTSVSLRLVGVVAAIFLVAIIAVPVLAMTAERPTPTLALDHAVIAVSDRARSDHFYAALLGATVEEGPEGRAAYRIGAARLNVHHPGVAPSPLAARPVAPGNSDLCFAWPGSAESAVNHLHALGIPIAEGPALREGAGGLGVSVYCRDPDGSLIELIAYT